VDRADVGSNRAVVSNGAARAARQVAREVMETGDELGEDNSLDLDFTNLLSDDLLCVFTENHQLLLDNLDGLGVADYLCGLVDDYVVVVPAVVVRPIKVVEVGHGAIPPVIVKGHGGVASAFCRRRSRRGCGERGDNSRKCNK